MMVAWVGVVVVVQKMHLDLWRGQSQKIGRASCRERVCLYV